MLLCGLAIGGCSTDADVYALIQDHAYSPSDFRHAAANKAVRTVIAGNPFPEAPKRKAHGATLAAMQPVNWYQPLPFTPDAYFTDTPRGEHNPRYHVVVALNPDDSRMAGRTRPALRARCRRPRDRKRITPSGWCSAAIRCPFPSPTPRCRATRRPTTRDTAA